MKQMTFENIDLRKSDNLVITEDNLMSIGQKITFCAFNSVQRYWGIDLSRYVKGMYRNVVSPAEPDEVLSDGYEVLQECMLYLCNFMGQKLGDTYKIDKHGKVITIRHNCIRYITRFVKHYIGLYDNVTRFTPNTDIPCRNYQPTEEDYEKADAIIEKLTLTELQATVLEGYINQLRPVEIFQEYNIRFWFYLYREDKYSKEIYSPYREIRNVNKKY